MISEENEFKDLFNTIYSYYPKYYSFGSKLYMNSSEYLNYQKILLNKNNRIKLGDKCYFILKQVFKNYVVKKWESIEYPSLHYSVLLHYNQPILDDDLDLLFALNGKRFDLEIYVSLISNYFYSYIIETNLINDELIFNYHESKKVISKEQEELLYNKMTSIGLKKLKKNIANLAVPNVETELLYKDSVKVFNCLFSDIEKNF